MHLTALFMLVDFTQDSGGTLMRPGSHKWGTNPTYDNEYRYDDYPDQVHGEGSAGSVLILDSRLWHASAVNHTDKRRAALVVRYAPWWLNLESLRPGSDERARLTQDGLQENTVPPVPPSVFAALPEAVKPLFRHWVERN